MAEIWIFFPDASNPGGCSLDPTIYRVARVPCVGENVAVTHENWGMWTVVRVDFVTNRGTQKVDAEIRVVAFHP